MSGLEILTVWLVTSFNFCKGLLFYQPIWSLFILSELHSPLLLTGLLAAQSISTIIFEVPSGAIADLFGRKNCLVFSILLSILSMFLFSYGEGLWILLTAVIVNSFAESMQSGTDVAIIFDSLKEAKRENLFSRAISINSSMWPMGALVGSIVGGFIATHSFRTTFTATLIPFIFCFFLSLLMKEPKYEKEEHNIFAQISSSLSTVIKNTQIMFLLASGLLFFAFGELDHQMKPIFFQQHGLPLNYFGVFSAISFGASFLGSFYFSDWACRNFGAKQTLYGSVLFSAPMNFIATLSHNPYLAAFLVVSSSVFWGIRWPILSQLLNSNIESKQRATIISVQNLANHLGVAIFSPIYAKVMETNGIDSAFRTTAVLSLSTLFVLYKIKC